MKKIAIIYTSIHHKNTETLLKEASANLDIDIFKINQIKINELSNYKAIGFASGIYAGKFHKSIYNFIKTQRSCLSDKAFVICTSGLGKGHYAKKISKHLKKEGFDVLGEFECKGFDTFAFFKLFGGIAKGHPDEKDILKAKDFLKQIESKLQ